MSSEDGSSYSDAHDFADYADYDNNNYDYYGIASVTNEPQKDYDEGQFIVTVESTNVLTKSQISERILVKLTSHAFVNKAGILLVWATH